jgi:ribosome-associated protein
LANSFDALELATYCARRLAELKLKNITVFHVAPSLAITDYFVIATGLNARHVRSASDRLIEDLRERGKSRIGLEGYHEGRWVLVDLGDVVVHLFQEVERRFYDLELLWGDSPRIEIRDLEPAVETPAAETRAGAVPQSGASR